MSQKVLSVEFWALAELCALVLGAVSCGCSGDDDSEPGTSCTGEIIADALTPGSESVKAIFGISNEEIYAVGSKFHKYGITSGWQEINGVEDAYYADIWGSSPSDIFLVGVPGIHHFDGSTIEPMEHPQNDEVTSVWGTAPDNVWAAGEGSDRGLGHDLLRYDGHEWTVVQSFGTNEGCRVLEIWGLSEDDIWAAGSCLLHWDGSAWTKQELGFSGTVFGIWGAAAGDIWLVGRTAVDGNNTLIMHWDGKSLETVLDNYPYYDDESSMATSYAMLDIWGYGNNSIYAVGHDCAAYFDGEGWTFLRHFGGVGVFGESPANALAFSSWGGVCQLSCQ